MSSDPRAPGAMEEDLKTVESAWSSLHSVEPPELLDRAVLNAARRAVERPPRRRHWLAAFATVSVVVLALAVVVQQEQEPDEVPQRLERDAATPPLADQSADGAADSAMIPARRTAESSATEFRATQSEPAPPTAAKAASPDTLDLEEEAYFGGQQAPEREARTPEAWIEELRQLKSSGDTQSFERELTEFRQAYPNYALPADLLD